MAEGKDRDFSGVAIGVAANRRAVSVAVPHGGEAALANALRSSFGLSVPEMGGSTISADGAARLLGLQQDQFLLLIDEHASMVYALVVERLGDTAYLTDQSDSWMMLTMSGATCRAALERMCPIDLHPSVFPEGKVARTAMEHFGVIILHEGTNRYLLMSAMSSAASFRDAIETSLRSIL